MYGSEKDIKHNLFLFFIDGVVYTPATTLISITAVIPYFMAQLGAATFQIGLAASLALVCNFVAQPFFGQIASRSSRMHMTFLKILLLQRFIFLAFVLIMPFVAHNGAVLVWIFLLFWSLFNIFVGSYGVFYTPLLLKLLPPDRRGAIRGMGYAIGSGLGLGAAALIHVLLVHIRFPYNYTLIFALSVVLMVIDALIYFFIRMPREGIEPNEPMGMVRYIREMPSSISKNAPFRAMILTCMFLVAANSLLPYYTLYAIKVFSAAESHVAALAALAVIANAAGYIIFGAAVDNWGPRTTLRISAMIIILAGALALFTHSLGFLYAAWALANFGNIAYSITSSLLYAEVCPPSKLPLYVGVYSIISLALSSAVLLLLAPVLERIGFMVLFTTVVICGVLSLLCNLFILRIKRR